MPDVRHMRSVTEQYVHLQGLRLVPIGVPFLISAGWRAGWFTGWPGTIGRGPSLWFVALLTAAVAMSFVIRHWYEEHFGVVTFRWRDSGIVSAAAFTGCLLVTIALQLETDLPLSAPVLFVGVVVFTAGLQPPRPRIHYFVIAVACLAFVALQPLGVSLTVRDVLFDALIGAGLTVAGIGDHILLVNAFRPSRQGTADARTI